MPRYQVTLDGRTFIVEGDRPPNESEARQALNDYTAQEKPAADKSVGGFIGNAVSSTGKLLKDSATGLYGMAKFAADVMPGAPIQTQVARHKQMGEVVRNAPQIARAIGKDYKDAYGSLDAIGNTLYNDPARVASDLSAILSLGGTAIATKAPKVGAAIAKAGAATNPMQVLKPIAKATEYATAGAVRPMLKPGKGLRRQQDKMLEIERTALKEGAVTSGLAESKKKASAANATRIARGSSTTTPRDTLTQMPKSLERVERGLDHRGDLNKLAQVEAEAMDALPANVSAEQLLDKRRYLDRELNNAFRAQERGGAPIGIRQSGQKEILGNVRHELRDAAPGIADADDLTRRLAMVEAALEDAGLRAGDIPMGAALAGAGTAAAGLPGAGLVGGSFALGRTFPQIPLALGSIPVRATAAAAAPIARQPLLLAALIERLTAGRDE